MDMALLGTRAGACFAAYAVLGMSDGHDLVAHVIAVLVLALERLFDEFQHIKTANFIASTAADALFYFDGIDEFRGPGLSSPCFSCHGRHGIPPKKIGNPESGARPRHDIHTIALQNGLSVLLAGANAQCALNG
jgi:hypothetical protein